MQAVPKRLPLQLLNGWGKATEFSFVRVGDIFILSGSISSPSPQNPAQICTLPADALPAGDAIFTWLAAPGQCLRVDVRRSCADCCWWLGGPASELHANVVYTTQPGDPMVLANGWVPFTGAYATPSYFKQGNIVFLQGLTKDGDHNQPITTLPEGYRPQKKLIFATNKHDAQCRIAVHPDGIVRWEAGSTGHGWIPLDNIFFSTLPSAEGEPLPLGPNWDSFDNNTTHSSPTIFVQDGFVFLSGVAKYPTNDNWDEIARIPQTLAPRSRLVFAVEHAGGTGRVEVDPEGRVRWLNNPTASTDNWISLNGIFYFLEDAMTLFPVGPDEAITELYDASISDVPLYTPLVKHRCPRLLEEEIQERLQLPTATLRHLMRFVHQGSCGFKDDDGEHVFLLLEKSVNLLHLVQLEAECRYWLQQMIPRRPWDVLNLALKHGEKDVKQRVFLYVATHKCQFVGGQPLKECKEKVEDKDCALDLADMLLGTPETDLKNQWDALPVVAPPGSRGFEADLLYLYNTRNETGDCEIVLGILDDVTDKKVKEQEEEEGKQSKRRRAPVAKKGDEGERVEDPRPRIKAHSLILASCNEFFKTRLTTGIGKGEEGEKEKEKEQKKKRVVIELGSELQQYGFSVPALEAFLFYLYTGRCAKVRTPAIALLLLGAAEYHFFSPTTDTTRASAHECLLSVCRQTVEVALSVTNCLELLLLAWQVDDKAMVERALAFTVANYPAVANQCEEQMAELPPPLFHRILIRRTK